MPGIDEVCEARLRGVGRSSVWIGAALLGAWLAVSLAGCGSNGQPRGGAVSGSGGGAGSMNAQTGSGGGDAQTGSGGGGAAAGSGGGDAGAGTSKPPCLANPSDVIIIGDSYVTGFLSPALQPALAALDPPAASFRNYAVAGTSLANGGLGLIPPQLDMAIAANPVIRTVIMTGGGNDILICDANTFPGCRTECNVAGSSAVKSCMDVVAAATAVARQLMTRFADAGIKDVIYFFYPHITASNGGYREILDYSRPRAQAECDGAAAMTGGRLHCHFIDLVPPFAAAGGDMNPANFSVIDGIHPSQAGQNIIAQQIWMTMQSACVAMPAGSACCS